MGVSEIYLNFLRSPCLGRRGLQRLSPRADSAAPNSVNQAAMVLMAKAVATAFLEGGWNCKYDIAAAAGACRVFHQKPAAYVWLAAASNETGRLLAACFGDAWRDRVARVHPPRKHKGTT